MAMQEHKAYELRVPGEAQSLALVRMVVTSLAEAAGLTPDEIGKVEIAVDEACTNVLEHAYRTLSPPPPVDLCIQAGKRQIVIDIIDQGKTFDFGNYVLPKFPDHWNQGHTRGVGLYLIKECMDAVEYERLPDNRNRMRLTKHITGKKQAATAPAGDA
ncbi:MAG: ATP-binding protein [Phycisphaerae bacterium]|nr:ATP-binding protein [Phycisphaerae bacterium]